MRELKELLHDVVTLGWGSFNYSKEMMEKLTDELVKKGMFAQDEAKEFLEKMKQRGEEERKKVRGIVNEELIKRMEELDLPTRKDIQRIEQKLDMLLQKQDEK